MSAQTNDLDDYEAAVRRLRAALHAAGVSKMEQREELLGAINDFVFAAIDAAKAATG